MPWSFPNHRIRIVHPMPEEEIYAWCCATVSHYIYDSRAQHSRVHTHTHRIIWQRGKIAPSPINDYTHKKVCTLKKSLAGCLMRKGCWCCCVRTFPQPSGEGERDHLYQASSTRCWGMRDILNFSLSDAVYYIVHYTPLRSTPHAVSDIYRPAAAARSMLELPIHYLTMLMYWWYTVTLFCLSLFARDFNIAHTCSLFFFYLFIN